MNRIPELHGLSEDHHAALLLAFRCKKYSESDSGLSIEEFWVYVLESFNGHLAPHFEIEEEHLLPALEELGEIEMADRIRKDHATLREIIQSEAIGQALFKKFGEQLEFHVRYEERIVFEETQHRLDEKVLQKIDIACKTTPRGSPDWCGIM